MRTVRVLRWLSLRRSCIGNTSFTSAGMATGILHPLLDLPTGFLWSLRLPEQHRFSTRPIVLHLLRLLLLTQDSVLCGSDGNFSCTSVSCAPTPSVLRHFGVFDGTHCSAEFCCGGFLAMEATIRMARCRWFEDGLGSGVVFWIDVAHVHDRTRL